MNYIGVRKPKAVQKTAKGVPFELNIRGVPGTGIVRRSPFPPPFPPEAAVHSGVIPVVPRTWGHRARGAGRDRLGASSLPASHRASHPHRIGPAAWVDGTRTPHPRVPLPPGRQQQQAGCPVRVGGAVGTRRGSRGGAVRPCARLRPFPRRALSPGRRRALIPGRRIDVRRRVDQSWNGRARALGRGGRRRGRSQDRHGGRVLRCLRTNGRMQRVVRRASTTRRLRSS